MAAEIPVAPTFITLGPEGTDHERVTYRYLDFQGLLGVAQVELMDNASLIDEGPTRVLEDPNSFLVLCSAHLKVSNVTEEYPQEVVVVDEAIDATRDLSLLVRKDVDSPKTLGLVEATNGYTDLTAWETVDVPCKPVLSEMLLAGEVDAGITYTGLADEHPDLFRVEENYGEVITTWLIFGAKERSDYRGELIGRRMPWIFTGEQPPNL